jgi:putative acetyltransferase
LETGIHQPAALSLYRSAGFIEREPFAPYLPDPLSVFMEKRIYVVSST